MSLKIATKEEINRSLLPKKSEIFSRSTAQYSTKLIGRIEENGENISADSNGSTKVKEEVVNYDQKKIDKMALSSHDRITLVNPMEIYYLEAEKNYTTFILANKSIVVSKTIGEYESVLEKKMFFRIHRSIIINLTHLIEIRKSPKSKVILDNGICLNIARSRHTPLLNRVRELTFF